MQHSIQEKIFYALIHEKHLYLLQLKIHFISKKEPTRKMEFHCSRNNEHTILNKPIRIQHLQIMDICKIN